MSEKFIIGRKVGMTQVFENGKVVPVTVVEAGPNAVIQKKTKETDGYNAVQVGFADAKPKHVSKPEQGHFKKNDTPFKRVLKEFRICESNQIKVGDTLKADVFAVGDFVDVSGTSKGKGFQGPIKRHGQHRLKETHGTGPVVRQAGSMGANSTPSRIFKGKKLAGHMGAVKVTTQNLVVVRVDAENNLLAIKGAIPGPNKGIVTVTSAVKKVAAKGAK